MTENEAKLILDIRISRFDHACDVNIALEVAKNALTEIQTYRAIGTAEECQEAMERQIKKKVINDIDLELGTKCGNCASCREPVYNFYNFCPKCGYALEWSK